LIPIQHLSYASGKNSSDITLTIEAMDILYERKVDIFCIVTSDSDFTRLVNRIKENNLFLIGMGERKTPQPLINSYDTFFHLENKQTVVHASVEVISEKKDKITKKKENNKNPKKSNIPELTEVLNETNSIIIKLKDASDWAQWSQVVQSIRKTFPKFNPKSYGVKNKNFLEFLKDKTQFSFKQEQHTIFIRNA
jgi:tRNA/tmRNA/rRNA uracil-C5-methylase (TrmA/RlmC/RlmD family)